MKHGVIGDKIKQEFREYLVQFYTIRTIKDEFKVAGIEYDNNFIPDVSGERRELIEQHYHTIEVKEASTGRKDDRKLITLFENILAHAIDRINASVDTEEIAFVEGFVNRVEKFLERDGFVLNRKNIRIFGDAGDENEISVSEEAQKSIWGDDLCRVFLSHKTEVKEDVAKLKERLELFGIAAFVAHEDINPTEEWQREIENALFSMDALVALITDTFSESDWTDQEVGVAVGRRVPIIPVKLGRDPYGFIGKVQALSCSWGEAAKEIAKILLRQGRMLDVYVKAVQKCPSFDDGNILSEVLPSIERLSEQQAKDLMSAYNENMEVRGSFGFNGTNSFRYGHGLLYHLNRLTGRTYGLSESREIEVLS